MDVAWSAPQGAHLTGQEPDFAMLIRICIKGLICVLLCEHAVANPLHSTFRPITSFTGVYVMKEQKKYAPSTYPSANHVFSPFTGRRIWVWSKLSLPDFMIKTELS